MGLKIFLNWFWFVLGIWSLSTPLPFVLVQERISDPIKTFTFSNGFWERRHPVCNSWQWGGWMWSLNLYCHFTIMREVSLTICWPCTKPAEWRLHEQLRQVNLDFHPIPGSSSYKSWKQSAKCRKTKSIFLSCII